MLKEVEVSDSLSEASWREGVATKVLEIEPLETLFRPRPQLASGCSEESWLKLLMARGYCLQENCWRRRMTPLVIYSETKWNCKNIGKNAKLKVKSSINMLKSCTGKIQAFWLSM